jgi:enterochelin esterase-like enzyme
MHTHAPSGERRGSSARRGSILGITLTACLIAACAAPAPEATSSPVPVAPTVSPAPAATPTIPDSCDRHPSRVEHIYYPSLRLDQEVPARVYLPPCYDLTRVSYPTVYLLHGYPYDESEWENLGAVTLADTEIAAGNWPPFMIIMPRQPEPLFTHSDGGPRSYEAELVDGLVSYIDLTYRTDPRPGARAIAGISRGGVWALEIGLRNPDVFDTLAAVSPALSQNNPRQAYDPFHIVRGLGPFPKRIYLTAGTGDWALEGTQAFSQLLNGVGIAHEMVIFKGTHQDESWQPIVEPVLQFLISGFSQ